MKLSTKTAGENALRKSKKKAKDNLAGMLANRKAPLVEVDPLELTDKRLNPEEAVIQKREECLSICAKKRIGGQDELEQADRGSGPRLQFSEIIGRLKREIPQLKAVDGSPGNVALYFPRTDEEFKEARNEWDFGRDEFFLHHKYVGGFPKQEIPEYSTVDIDTSLIATRENRGWRSILITLLKQGVMSYKQAIRQFGDVGTDVRGWRWREQTHAWRTQPDQKFAACMRDFN